MGTFTRDNTELAVDLDGWASNTAPRREAWSSRSSGGRPGSTRARCSSTFPTVPARSTTGATSSAAGDDPLHRRQHRDALGRAGLPPASGSQRAHRRRRRVRRVHAGRRRTGHQHRCGVVAVTLYGVAALTFMMMMYARRSAVVARFVLLFALGCALSSVYGFLSGAWPFGVVELIWCFIALRRYQRQPVVP